jgi:hypothetical protein
MVFLYQEMTIEQRSYPVLVAHLSSPIPCRSPSFSWVYSIWAITRSFVLHLYTNPSLLPVHLRQATKLTLKVQNTSSHVLVWKWFLIHKSFLNFPSRNGPIMIIIPSSSCLQYQLIQAFEYSTITQYFMVTNHPIMSGHPPQSNAINQIIKLAS